MPRMPTLKVKARRSRIDGAASRVYSGATIRAAPETCVSIGEVAALHP